MVLTLEGKCIPDDLPLSSYQFAAGSSLHLFYRGKGGGCAQGKLIVTHEGMPPVPQEQHQDAAIGGARLHMAVTAAAKKAAGGGEEEKAAYVSACRAAGVSPVPNGSTWHKNGGAELEPLLDFTTLIDVRWLLKVAEGEVTCVDERGDQLPTGVVPAWQQLPEEAKARLDQMWTSRMGYGLPVGVLSYGWASKVCRGLSAPSPLPPTAPPYLQNTRPVSLDTVLASPPPST